ncbi:MAG TPA: hypothetical protein VG621_02825 [Candidatus Paceibacterota bacterium]|nr:hypothetical protein [Candidatus Paceibacterota bacterium]
MSEKSNGILITFLIIIGIIVIVLLLRPRLTSGGTSLLGATSAPVVITRFLPTGHHNSYSTSHFSSHSSTYPVKTYTYYTTTTQTTPSSYYYPSTYNYSSYPTNYDYYSYPYNYTNYNTSYYPQY